MFKYRLNLSYLNGNKCVKDKKGRLVMTENTKQKDSTITVDRTLSKEPNSFIYVIYIIKKILSIVCLLIFIGGALFTIEGSSFSYRLLAIPVIIMALSILFGIIFIESIDNEGDSTNEK